MGEGRGSSAVSLQWVECVNILFIAPYVPSRIRVRPYHFIKELAKRHELHVLALGEPGGAKSGSEELASEVSTFDVKAHSKLRGLAQSFIALPTPVPMCAAYCWSSAMQARIRNIIRDTQFDVVHIEHLRAAHFAKSCENLPVVFDSVDCLTGLFGQLYHSKKNPIAKLIMLEEHLKLKRYEPRVLASFQGVAITSQSERDELIALNKSLNIEVTPNGVDTDYFSPMSSTKNPHQIVFSGKMGYHPNAQAALWFADGVFPAVKRKHPQAEFVIVGSDPPAEILKLEDRPGITVTGYVDDIRSYLDSSGVAVVPMQVAVGVQNKALEAMAMNLPVVATPISTRPLGVNCPGIIQAGSISDMIDEVSNLLDQPKLAGEIGEQGRQEVVRNFSWKSSVAKLEILYEKAIKEF